MRKLILAACLLALFVSPAFAGNILYWTDFNVGTSVIPDAITLAGYTGVAATDGTDFANKISLGGWSLIIVGEQDTSTYGSFGTQLTAWIAGGGRAIGATWLSGSGTANLFQGSSTGTNGLSIPNTGGPLFNGIVGDVGLYNPGWGTFSQYYSPIGSASCLSNLGGYGCAVVLGNNGQTLLNAPLFDSYADYDTGVQFVANEIGYLSTPEPTTLLLLGSGILGIAARFRRQ